MNFSLLFCLLLISETISILVFPGNSIINNSNWLDTNNNFIHAHGGQILEYNNIFYLIGTTQKEPPNFLSSGINCYKSTDLTNWEYITQIFTNTSIINVPSKGPFRIERPKILYNSKYNNFVMWFHLHTSSFSLQMVGVAKSNEICGYNSYQFISGFQPDNLASYDMGLYQDITSNTIPLTSYLIRSVNNEYAGISYLTDNYLNTTSNGIISKGPKIEGLAVFKLDTYYLIGSHLTGWSPNAAELCVTVNTNSLNNASWKNCNNPTNSSTTYNSQSTFVVKLIDNVNKQFVYMFMADIWNYPQYVYFFLVLIFVFVFVCLDFFLVSKMRIIYGCLLYLRTMLLNRFHLFLIYKHGR